MPRVAFSEENRAATTNYEYLKLKLKSGEKARILVGLEDPVMEYVHTLRKPQIVNGVPVTKMVHNDRSGTDTLENVMDFIGRPVCLGDLAVLKVKGVDPKNCPACALAVSNPDAGQAPQRRYAMHVIRYRTKGGTTDIATPFSVELPVWSFTDKVYNKLLDLKKDFDGKLLAHDLLLGPCTNETFQQFDITPSMQAEWTKDATRKQIVKDTFRENQIPDLTIACGSPKQKSWIQQDVDTILEQWAQVKGIESSASSTDLDTDLSDLLGGTDDVTTEDSWAPASGDDDLDALLGTTEVADDVAEVAAEEDTDDDDLAALLGGEEPAPKKAPAKRAPAAKKEPEPVEEAEEATEEAADDLDDLLADLR